MHNSVEISASALVHNCKVLREITAPSTMVPVLKSNAYGHGLKETYSCIKGLKFTWLCVNYIDEGVVLRKLKFKGRILVCGPVTSEDITIASKFGLDVFIGSHETLNKVIKTKNKKIRIHIEFDTGMSRQGFSPENIRELMPKLQGLNIAGACMHFANVEDVTNQTYALEQLDRFEKVRKILKLSFPKILFHAAASAPALILKKSRFDLCRAGIATYGLWPSALTKLSFHQSTKQKFELVPALTWVTKLTQLNAIRAGQFVGYGCTFKASHDMIIGVVPVGYFEGYPRAASKSRAHVLIDGERCAIVGRICMNMMMVDVTEVKSAAVGSVVTLIGHDQKEQISAEDIASWCDSINYEVVSRLNSDLPRFIKR